MNKFYYTRKTYFVLCLLSIFLCGCEDFDEPNDLNFDISVSNINEIDPETGAYIVNTSDNIEFTFHGDVVDNILFYSGALGEECRYRNRWLANKDATIKPQVRIKTAALSLKNLATTGKFEFLMAFDDDIPKEYTDETVAATQWTHYPLRSRSLTSGSAVTEYFDFNTGLVNANGNFDYNNWFSHNEVVYGVRAKSNVASTNRLQLQEFYVSNTETRDYSYSYQGKVENIKKPKEYVIFKDCSILDQNLRISNTETAASWGMYTPTETIKEGESTPVPNSQYYAWNAPEFGLKYGELTGSFPWTDTNKFGQKIRSTYSMEIFIPTQNFRDKDGNLILDANGKPISAPTNEMMNEPCESWVISGKHNIHKVFPDSPSSYVKTKSQSMMSSFTYSYAEIGKGLYTATFIINNQTHTTTKEIVKEFKFLVK